MQKVFVPAGVVFMGGHPFAAGDSLETITADPANPFFSSDAGGVLFNKEKTALVAVPGMRRGDYEVPDGVTAILGHALECCHHLSSVTLPPSVRRIGTRAFRHCCNLRRVIISEGLETIGAEAFARCTMLEEVILPASLRNLESAAFAGMSSLRAVHFLGNAPGGTGQGSLFAESSNVTVYYRTRTKGWGETFGGRPVKVWEED